MDKNKKITAADLDGTYSDHPEIWGETEFIVTGNTYEDYDHVRETMFGLPSRPIFLNPVQKTETSPTENALHKANVINKIGVSKFYEDSPQQAEIIKILAPRCSVVLVRNGVTSI